MTTQTTTKQPKQTKKAADIQIGRDYFDANQAIGACMNANQRAGWNAARLEWLEAAAKMDAEIEAAEAAEDARISAKIDADEIAAEEDADRAEEAAQAAYMAASTAGTVEEAEAEAEAWIAMSAAERAAWTPTAAAIVELIEDNAGFIFIGTPAGPWWNVTGGLRAFDDEAEALTTGDTADWTEQPIADRPNGATVATWTPGDRVTWTAGTWTAGTIAIVRNEYSLEAIAGAAARRYIGIELWRKLDDYA